ncbi:MAG: hypothetical protein ACYC99_14050, partial [Candidatus Geothermincolia bacterium]
MPVCLKCGKEIETGRNFCEDCKALGPGEVRELMDAGHASKYKPRRTRGALWVTIIVVVLLLVALGVGWALLSMIPSNEKVQANVRAGVCRNNLERVQAAIDKYYKNSHQYPSTGKLNSRNPLVLDGYLSGVPHCPSTGHEYLIEE